MRHAASAGTERRDSVQFWFIVPRATLRDLPTKGEPMKALNRTSFFAATALALGALGATSAAHARSDAVLSIALQAPSSYYVQPAPVYESSPLYVQPEPVYVHPPYQYVYDEHARRQQEWRREQWRREQWRREQIRLEELRREEWRRHHDWREHHGWDQPQPQRRWRHWD
jgi:hypothetical protein